MRDLEELRSRSGVLTWAVHAYGRLDTAQAAQDFGETVRRMRAGVEQYKGWRATGPDATAQQTDVHRYLLVLRDHTEQQEHLQRVRSAIAGAVAMAREQSASADAAAGGLQLARAVSHLEDIAAKLSLNFFWDEDSGIFTLLLDNLLFDIHFVGHVVEEVKVTHIIDGNTTSAPSQLLKELVMSRSWEELQATLAWMSDGPKLLAANPQLPQALLQTFESALLEVTAAESQGTLEADICSGHGLARRTEAGVALACYCSPFFSLQPEARQEALFARKGWMQLAEAKRSAAAATSEAPTLLQRAFVTLQRLSFTTSVHVTNLTSGGAWSTPQAVGSTETNVCCSLVLDPPVAAAAHSELFAFLPRNSAAAADCAPCAAGEHCSRDATLLDLLHLGTESDMELNGTKMKFVYSGEPGAAIMLHRLPIAQPQNLLPVLDHLRQQLVFNELLRSCYLPAGAADSTDGCTVFEVMYEAPEYISVMLLNTHTQEFVNLDVQLTGGVALEAHFSPAQSAMPDAKATALLQRSRHIPLTLMALLQCNR